MTAREIDQLIRHVQQKYHASSIIISHDIDCVRLTSDRVILLAEGRNYVEGTYAELLAGTDPTVHAFFD